LNSHDYQRGRGGKKHLVSSPLQMCRVRLAVAQASFGVLASALPIFVQLIGREGRRKLIPHHSMRIECG
ncbi:hypothetical protein PFISCL1PPCAC_1852, partial [Pristionchus fissidentatus]